MLRRDRQIRMQIHQLMDTFLFTIGFLLAYILRSDPDISDVLRLPAVSPFEEYVWLYLILIPAVPMILEAQGFYRRPMLCSRRMTFWLLLKACAVTTLVLILTVFLFRVTIARSVIIWFGFISFGLVADPEITGMPAWL